MTEPAPSVAPRPDPETFRRLVERYQGLVFQYVFQVVRDYHLTEDLSQEVFFKVYRSFHAYDPRYVLSTWLLRVAHNHTIDHLRKRRLATVSIDERQKGTGAPLSEAIADPEPETAKVVEARRTEAAVREVIDGLPPEQRGLLALRFLEGRKMEEIAYILDLPLGTVKSRLNRARAVLQRRMGRLGYEEGSNP